MENSNARKITARSDNAAIRRTLERRAAAWKRLGRPQPATCPICVRAFDAPFMRRDARHNVTEGCVDACHAATAAQVPGSYRDFYSNQSARQCRAAMPSAKE